MKLRTFKRLLCVFLVNYVFVGTRCFKVKNKLLNIAGYNIGKGTRVVGPFFCTASLTVGENCWLGRELNINGNGSVVVGDNCDIAPEVTFLTGGHEIGDARRRAGKGEKYDIRVGDGVWIGSRTTLGRTINVGDSSVIAACACVMKDVDSNKLVGGVPARVIKELDD